MKYKNFESVRNFQETLLISTRFPGFPGVLDNLPFYHACATFKDTKMWCTTGLTAEQMTGLGPAAVCSRPCLLPLLIWHTPSQFGRGHKVRVGSRWTSKIIRNGQLQCHITTPLISLRFLSNYTAPNANNYCSLYLFFLKSKLASDVAAYIKLTCQLYPFGS